MGGLINMDIIREDPPAVENHHRGARANQHWLEVADHLQDDPGNWYKVAEEQRFAELAARIRKGAIVAFRPSGSFEATARKVDGVWSIWARYVGEGTDEVQPVAKQAEG